MTAPEHDTEPTDAHLRAALRHAPDRDIAPPPRLREQLARAARTAVAPPAGPPWWQRWWSALAAPRPVWAGALGALLVGSLTLRMWWGEPPPPAVVADTPEAAAGVAPQAEAPRVVAASAAPAASPAALPAAPAAAPAAPPPPAPAAAERRAAPAPAIAPLPAARPRAAPAATPATERAEAPPGSADMIAAPTPPAAEPTAEAKAAPPPPAAPSTIPSADVARGATMGQSIAQPMQESMRRGAPPSPLRALRDRATAALQAGGDWRWQPPRSPAPLAMDTAALATLARIDQSSVGRWRPDTQPAGDAVVPMLRWWQGDQLQGALRIEPDALRFTDAAGARWRAELPPEVIATLLPP